MSWPTANYNMQQQPNNNVYCLQRPYETHVSPQAYVNQQCPIQNSFNSTNQYAMLLK